MRVLLTANPGFENTLLKQASGLLQRQGAGQQGRDFALKTVAGGVECCIAAADLDTLAQNLTVAQSIRVRVGPERKVRSFPELEKHIKGIPWHAFVPNDPKVPVDQMKVRASCKRSKLYHTSAVEDRVQKFVARGLSKRKPALFRETRREYTALHPPLLHVRLHHDVCQGSVEAARDLHKRGYRKYVSKASLKETNASACLLHTELLTTPLKWIWDPFAGSGVMSLESLLLLGGYPSRLSSSLNDFDYRSWPCFDGESDGYVRITDEQQDIPFLISSDGSKSALSMIKGNTRLFHSMYNTPQHHRQKTMSFLGDIEEAGRLILKRFNSSEGAIITNVPYGKESLPEKRISALKETYHKFGELLRSHPFKRVIVVSGNSLFEKCTQPCQWKTHLHFKNGGLPVRLLELDTNAGKSAD